MKWFSDIYIIKIFLLFCGRNYNQAALLLLYLLSPSAWNKWANWIQLINSIKNSAQLPHSYFVDKRFGNKRDSCSSVVKYAYVMTGIVMMMKWIKWKGGHSTVYSMWLILILILGKGFYMFGSFLSNPKTISVDIDPFYIQRTEEWCESSGSDQMSKVYHQH